MELLANVLPATVQELLHLHLALQQMVHAHATVDISNPMQTSALNVVILARHAQTLQAVILALLLELLTQLLVYADVKTDTMKIQLLSHAKLAITLAQHAQDLFQLTAHHVYLLIIGPSLVINAYVMLDFMMYQAMQCAHKNVMLLV